MANKLFNLFKIFVLRLFKKEADQTDFTKLKQRSVIKFFVAETCKQCENT